MPVEVRMPSLGMTMEEGRVVAWLVREGQRVSQGQILLEIESEKVAYEVESPADGVVERILVAADATVPVGTPLVRILGAGAPASVAVPGTAGPAAPRPSPRARRLAEELGVDCATVAGSGPGGTIVEQDIRAAAARGETPSTLRGLTSMRRAIADRMTQSAREAPHFFLGVEVDGTALLRGRATHAPRLQAETGLALTITDLLLQAAARTLAAHRHLNAAYTPEGIREWDRVNLGLAVAVEGGLVVPVIRGAEGKSLAELMAARVDVVARARGRKLTADDLRGGTFTLSNLGGLGVDVFTSILNPGEGGILSVGALRERAAVVDGRVVARAGMFIGLTIDHRVTDGAEGARFLADLRGRLEHLDLDA